MKKYHLIIHKIQDGYSVQIDEIKDDRIYGLTIFDDRIYDCRKYDVRAICTSTLNRLTGRHRFSKVIDFTY